MRLETHQPLPANLRSRAEDFFRADLSAVELVVGPQPAALEALAYAEGERIYLEPDAADFSRQTNLEILGHELAHVLQQRQRRVTVDGAIDGRPISLDPLLEQEAQEMGSGFARGDRGSGASLSCNQRPRPVIQRLVSVSGEPLHQVDQLTPKVRLIVELIQRGEEWLAWAIAQPDRHFAFAHELELVEGLQSGLHDSPMVIVEPPGLQVSPARLFGLNKKELRLLVRHLRDRAEANELGIKKILTHRGLRTESELELGLQCLDELGVRDQPHFQTLNLGQRIALFELFYSSAMAEACETVKAEAARFALKHASGPLEFIDLFDFYLTLGRRLESQAPGGASRSSAASSKRQEAAHRRRQAAKRQREAEGLLEEILPMFFDRLGCPSWKGKEPLPGEVSTAVRQSILNGRPVGFPRLTRGLQQSFKHGSIEHRDAWSLRSAVDEYWRQAQRFLTQNIPIRVELAQDGLCRCYVLKTPEACAELVLDPAGDLTLHEFSHNPPGQVSAARP